MSPKPRQIRVSAKFLRNYTIKIKTSVLIHPSMPIIFVSNPSHPTPLSALCYLLSALSLLSTLSASRIAHRLMPPDHRRHSRCAARHGQTHAPARIARSRIGVVGALRTAALARARLRDARACGQACDGVESDVFGRWRWKWKGRGLWIERIRVASRARHWFSDCAADHACGRSD